MGFFFKSKRSTNHSNQTAKKPAKIYASEIDPTSLLSESPKATSSSLFSENPRSTSSSTIGNGKSLLDDILDTFEDKSSSTIDNNYKKANDYDFLKNESNDQTPYSRYSNDKFIYKFK